MNDYLPTRPGDEDDKGLLLGMADGTPLAQLRMTAVVGFAAAPLMIAAVGTVVIGPTLGFDPVALVPVAAGFTAAVAAAVIPVRPLAHDTPEHEAAAASSARFRSLTMVRLALCEVPVLTGLVASFAFDTGITPLLIGVVIAMVALPSVALPTRAVIERFRRGLEARGARSYLWEGLRGLPVGRA